MSDEKKVGLTLTDEDMITSPRLSRRMLLAGVGVALGTVALAGRSAMAADSEEKDKADAEADKGDAEDDKDKGDAERWPRRVANKQLRFKSQQAWWGDRGTYRASIRDETGRRRGIKSPITGKRWGCTRNVSSRAIQAYWWRRRKGGPAETRVSRKAA